MYNFQKCGTARNAVSSKRLFLIIFMFLSALASIASAAEKPLKRQRLLKKPLIYSQAQLKYGLNIPFYYSRWSDRPLLIDPELADPGREVLYISPVKASWYTGWVHKSDMLKRMETVRSYSLDGFGIHPFNLRSSNDYIIKYCDEGNVPGFTWLPLLYGNNIPELRTMMEKIAASGSAVRVNGKNLVVYKYGKVPPEIRDGFKDRFIFLGNILPSHKWWEKFYRGEDMTREKQEAQRQLREFLREWDGGNWWYMYSWYTVDHYVKRLAWEFYQDFLTPLTQEVLSEPEFRNKYWGAEAVMGHENTYNGGYSLSSDGTKNLRRSFEIAMQNNVDYIVQLEWDEENENSCFRPTIYNSFINRRIARYYCARLRNEPLPEPCPGDDITIPGLALTTRKVLTYGERINLELLNIPDSESHGEYKVTLSVKDENGRLLHTFPKHTFKANQMQDQTYYLASEKFGGTRMIMPVLDIEYKGRKLHYEQGLQGIEIKPLINNDFKFVSQPLRDIAWDVKGTLSEEKSPEAGLKRFKVKLTSPQKLAYVELLQDHICVYSHDKSAVPARESEKYYAIRIQPFLVFLKPEGLRKARHLTLKLRNGQMTGRLIQTMMDQKLKPVTDNTLQFRFDVYMSNLILLIEKNGSENAVFDVIIDGAHVASVPLADVIAKHTLAMAHGELSLSFQRALNCYEHPRRLMCNSVEFNADIIPAGADSPVMLQGITESGKLWRSAPLFPGRNDSEAVKRITVFSETTGSNAEVMTAADRVQDFTLDISDRNGTVMTSCGNARPIGIRGGYIEQFSDHGGADLSYGNRLSYHSVMQGGKGTENLGILAPDIVTDEHNEKALRFNGNGSHVQLGEFLPRLGAYELSFKVKPEETGGIRELFSAYNKGYIHFRIFLKDGVLQLTYNGVPYNSRLRVPAGTYSTVKITQKMNHSIRFEVNGRARVFPCRQRVAMITAPFSIGGSVDAWYKGLMKDIKVDYSDLSVEDPPVPPVEAATSGKLTPDAGFVSVNFSPDWENESRLQIGQLFNSRSYLRDQKRGRGPLMGINRHADGKTFLWFYVVDPGKAGDWGFYIPLRLENNQKYEAAIGWQGKRFFMILNGKVIAEGEIPFNFELSEKCFIGGRGATAEAVKLYSYNLLPQVPKEFLSRRAN